MIKRIAFIRPINVAGKDLPSYSSTRDGDIRIQDKGNFYLFTRVGVPGESTKVYVTSIVDIGLVDDPVEPVPPPVAPGPTNVPTRGGKQ